MLAGVADGGAELVIVGVGVPVTPTVLGSTGCPSSPSRARVSKPVNGASGTPAKVVKRSQSSGHTSPGRVRPLTPVAGPRPSGRRIADGWDVLGTERWRAERDDDAVGLAPMPPGAKLVARERAAEVNRRSRPLPGGRC